MPTLGLSHRNSIVSLPGDETIDEQREALVDLLTGVTDESAIEKLVTEILDKWSLTQTQIDKEAAAAAQVQLEDVDTKLAKLLEANIKTSDKKREYTEEEQKLRSRILEDYGQVGGPLQITNAGPDSFYLFIITVE